MAPGREWEGQAVATRNGLEECHSWMTSDFVISLLNFCLRFLTSVSIQSKFCSKANQSVLTKVCSFHSPSLSDDRYYLHVLLDTVSVFLSGMVNSLPLLKMERKHHYTVCCEHKPKNIFCSRLDSCTVAKAIRIKK